VELAPGTHTLVVRAVDSAAQIEPEDLHSVWNFKGYCSNAWHRVAITVDAR
jgi:sulfite oxidase